MKKILYGLGLSYLSISLSIMGAAHSSDPTPGWKTSKFNAVMLNDKVNTYTKEILPWDSIPARAYRVHIIESAALSKYTANKTKLFER